MKNKKSVLNIILLVAITGLVLYFSLKDDFDNIIHEILTLNPLWFLVAVFFVVCYWLFKAIEVHQVICDFKPDYSFKQTLRLMLSTQFFNAITPFASGGQPFQIYMLSKSGVKLTDSTNIIIQNFIVYQIPLVFLGVVALISNHFGHFYKEVHLLKYLVTLGFIINTAVIIGLFIVAFAKKINKKIMRAIIYILSKLRIVKNKEQKQQEFEEYINRFHAGAKLLMQDKKQFISSILYNLVALICLYLIPLALLFAMGDYGSMNIFQVLVTSAYVMLIGSFVPIPGGTGGLEYGFIAFFGNFIVGSKLNAVMLLWRAITYYLGLIVGAVAFNIKERN